MDESRGAGGSAGSLRTAPSSSPATCDSVRLGAGGLLAAHLHHGQLLGPGLLPPLAAHPRSLPRAKSHHGQKPGGEIPPLLSPLVERPGCPPVPPRPPRGRRGSPEPTALPPSRGLPLPRLLLPKVASLINTFPLLPLLLMWPEAAQSFKKKKKRQKAPRSGPLQFPALQKPTLSWFSRTNPML